VQELKVRRGGFHQANNNCRGLGMLLYQIPEDWYQIAVRFRRDNGILDADKERSLWWLC